jgi:hypothetical protein
VRGDATGWENYLKADEVLKWSGEPSHSVLFWRLVVFVSCVLLVSIIPARDVFVHDSLAAACGANPRSKCQTIYQLRIPFLLLIWGYGLFLIIEHFLQRVGLLKRYFAITNKRALSRLDGLVRRVSFAEWQSFEVFPAPFGEVRFADMKRPKLRFVGLSEFDRQAALDSVSS